MLGWLSYLQARARRHAVNSGSAASDPVGLRLSDPKLRRLCPSLYPFSGPGGFLRCLFVDGLGWRFYIRDMLVHGDSRAAVVMSVSPLLVACYCDDLDGVCLLRFSEELAREHALTPGSRLLTVLNSMCLYRPAGPEAVARDIVQGAAANPLYVNFWPLVAEFLSDDYHAIAARREGISQGEYDLCRALGKTHLGRFGGAARDGRPDRSMRAVGDKRFTTW
jgi:hypothetical protein